MNRLLLPTLAVIAGLSVVIGIARHDIAALNVEKAALTDKLAVADAVAAQAQQAADVLADHNKRLAAQIVAFDAIRASLATMEGRDAPVSDLVRATVGCLRAARAGGAPACP